ncbi:MAG: hypothetical protein AB1730_18760 [Myxococcota bacterium]
MHTPRAVVALACLALSSPAFAQPDDLYGVGGFGRAQGAVQRNKSAYAVLDEQVGPAMEKLLGQRKLTPWEQSVVHTKVARTRIVAGALTKKVNDNALSTLLTENGKSSNTPQNPYVKLTKEGGENSYEMQLARRIQAMKQAAPQDVMAAALDVCHQDYWLATLTAHNLLKEVTYAARTDGYAFVGWTKGDNSDDLSIDAKSITSRLIDLRPEGDPNFGDRMGPWYHAFGLFFVGGITSGAEAQLMADLENVTRLLRAGSPPDEGKERVNAWAARLSSKLNGVVAKQSTGEVTRPEKAARPPKDLKGLSKAQLEGYIDSLKAEHRALQDVLAGLPPGADAQGNAIRAEQKSLYTEVMRLKKELGTRR